LVAPAAVDIDSLERRECGRMLGDEEDRVVLQPVAPARVGALASSEVERQGEAERRLTVGVVGRRHADVHDRVALAVRELLLAPYGVEKALDAAIVKAG